MRSSAIAALALLAVGCQRASPDPRLTPAAFSAICSHADLGPDSRLFVALDDAGTPTRVVANPDRSRQPDLGNVIFDMQGKHLGHGTGSEFPRHDDARWARERERVAGLMGGAVIPEGATTVTCGD